MADPKPFAPVKLICGIISAAPGTAAEAERRLAALYGAIDIRSPAFPFDLTDYYEAEMGPGLERRFLSFAELIRPEALAGIKLRTNDLEEEIRRDSRKPPSGRQSRSGLPHGRGADHGHDQGFRPPRPARGRASTPTSSSCSRGRGSRLLDWTYPDLRGEGYREFFRAVRARYLEQSG